MNQETGKATPHPAKQDLSQAGSSTSDTTNIITDSASSCVQHVTTDFPAIRPYVPNKKLGVVFEPVTGIPLEDYLRAVADKIGGLNIRYASRLSGGRVCVYLSHLNFVEELCAEGGVTICDIFVQCRRYVSAARKIVLSNVVPDIKNETLTRALQSFGQPTSSITEIPISTIHEDLKHIKSFRRCVYMLIPKLEQIPSTISIENEGTVYNVFVTCDDITCLTCGKSGHTSRFCRASPANITAQSTYLSVASKVHSPPVTSDNQPLRPAVVTSMPVRVQARTRLAKEDFPPLPAVPPTVATKSSISTTTAAGVIPKTPVATNVSANPQPTDTSLRPLRVTEEISQPITASNDSTIVSTVPSPPVATRSKRPTYIDLQEIETLKRPLTERLASDGDNISEADSQSSFTSQMEDDIERAFADNTLPVTKNDENSATSQHIKSDTVPAKPAHKNKATQPLTAEQFKSFINDSRHYKKIIPIVEKYTMDFRGVQQMVDRAIDTANNINMKRRLQRISKSIASEILHCAT